MKRRLAAALLAASATAACAAGGHFDVDDATILETGHCQVELWSLSGQSSHLPAWHLGPACRAGAAEWGLNLDDVGTQGARTRSVGAQLKWVADPAARRLSAGFVLALARRTEGSAQTLATAYVPLTLWLGLDGQTQWNANYGRDRDSASDTSTPRWGVALDQTLDERWTLTAERRSQGRQTLSRAGARFSFGPLLSVDASWAQGGDRTRVWGLGLNWEWEP